MSQNTDAYLDFGPFRIDLANQQLLHNGTPVDLTPKAFDTLRALVERRGRVVGKDELLRAVWLDAFVTEATLTQNIYTLRKVFAESVPEGRFIETVPRRGYRFAADVRSVAVASRSASQQGARQEGAIRSIAVLPLRTLGLSEEESYLGLGLADALITSLSKVRQLAVRATSSILRYADPESVDDPIRLGRALGVDGVLEGTVQRAGDRLRTTVQLVSVEQGVPCWADRFQGVYTDLFDAQDAIGQAVVASLRLTLTQQEEARLSRRSTLSLEANRAYVRGRYYWNRRTADDLHRASDLFRQAASADGGYAQAYAGLADALILLPLYSAIQPSEAFREAREAAVRARDLDPSLAEAHTSLAYTDFVYSRRWRTAEERFRTAIECNPHYPTAFHWYAFLVSSLGRHEEAIQHATRALELDPLSLVIHTDLAMVTYFARRYDEAVKLQRAVLELDEGFAYAHFGLGFSLCELGRYREAVIAARRAVELLPDSTAMLGALGYVLGVGDRKDEAQQVIDMLSQRSERQPVQAAHLALALLGLGEREAALDALEKAAREHSRFAAFLDVWPVFDPVREEPRFKTLLRRVGLG